MTWQYYIFSIWPISGWIAGYRAMPKWVLPEDTFSLVIIFLVGAVIGPFGFIWGRDRF